MLSSLISISCRPRQPYCSTLSSLQFAAVVSTYKALVGAGWNAGTGWGKLAPALESRVIGVCDNAMTWPCVCPWPRRCPLDAGKGLPRCCCTTCSKTATSDRALFCEVMTQSAAAEFSVVCSNVMLLMLSTNWCTSTADVDIWIRTHNHSIQLIVPFSVVLCRFPEVFTGHFPIRGASFCLAVSYEGWVKTSCLRNLSKTKSRGVWVTACAYLRKEVRHHNICPVKTYFETRYVQSPWSCSEVEVGQVQVKEFITVCHLSTISLTISVLYSPFAFSVLFLLPLLPISSFSFLTCFSNSNTDQWAKKIKS